MTFRMKAAASGPGPPHGNSFGLPRLRYQDGATIQLDAKELDAKKRTAMVRQAEAMLENDPPLIPVAYEQIYDAYYNSVKGINPRTFFGIYDVVRWDVVWLAK